VGLWAASIALQMALAALAWRYASAHPRHRAAAALLSWMVVRAVLGQVLAIVNAPAYVAAQGAPLTGWPRAVFHLDELLQLSWPAGLAAVACLVLLEEPHRRRAAAAAGASWALAWLVLVLGYPTIRRALLGRVYLALELVALATVITAAVSWWRRRPEPSLVEGSVGVLWVSGFVALLRWSPFNGWDWQLTAYLLGYGTLAVLHGGEVCCPRPSSSSS